MKWTKEKFIKEFGEDPEDIFGPDWENYVDEYVKQELRSVPSNDHTIVEIKSLITPNRQS